MEFDEIQPIGKIDEPATGMVDVPSTCERHDCELPSARVVFIAGGPQTEEEGNTIRTASPGGLAAYCADHANEQTEQDFMFDIGEVRHL